MVLTQKWLEMMFKCIKQIVNGLNTTRMSITRKIIFQDGQNKWIGVGFVSSGRRLVLKTVGYNQQITKGYALKYYPNRGGSMGIIRTGAAHYFEAGMELIDGSFRGITGVDNAIYNMHYLNSQQYLRYR